MKHDNSATYMATKILNKKKLNNNFEGRINSLKIKSVEYNKRNHKMLKN